MFSQTAEYALRAVVALASKPGTAQTAQQVSDASQVPLDYLFKVLQLLGRAGLVTGQRGKGGGFQLARPGNEIAVLEVVNAVDPIRRIKACPLGIPAHARGLCPLHRKLDDAFRSMEEAFAETAVAELAEAPEEAAHAKSR
jgi:Rrf2 family protein